MPSSTAAITRLDEAPELLELESPDRKNRMVGTRSLEFGLQEHARHG
jgi:hypothetical protein